MVVPVWGISASNKNFQSPSCIGTVVVVCLRLRTMSDSARFARHSSPRQPSQLTEGWIRCCLCENEATLDQCPIGSDMVAIVRMGLGASIVTWKKPPPYTASFHSPAQHSAMMVSHELYAGRCLRLEEDPVTRLGGDRGLPPTRS